MGTGNCVSTSHSLAQVHLVRQKYSRQSSDFLWLLPLSSQQPSSLWFLRFSLHFIFLLQHSYPCPAIKNTYQNLKLIYLEQFFYYTVKHFLFSLPQGGLSNPYFFGVFWASLPIPQIHKEEQPQPLPGFGTSIVSA